MDAPLLSLGMTRSLAPRSNDSKGELAAWSLKTERGVFAGVKHIAAAATAAIIKAGILSSARLAVADSTPRIKSMRDGTFLHYAIGTIVLVSLSCYIEEWIFKQLPGFHFHWFVALVELFIFALLGLLGTKQKTDEAWQQRKGPDVLLKAYWNAFRKDDDVVLRVRAKVPGWGGNPFKTAQGGVKHWARALWNTSPDQLAKVEVVTARDGEDATREDMAGECIFIIFVWAIRLT